MSENTVTPAPHQVTVEVGGRPLILETGKIAKQANGAITARYGAIGLLGDFAGFENQRASADFDGDLVRCGCNCIFRHEQSFPLARHPSRASSGAYMDGP